MALSINKSFSALGIVQGDITKVWVLENLILVSLLLTIFGINSGAAYIIPFIYIIPIVLVVLWYPRASILFTCILVAGFSAIILLYANMGADVDLIYSGVWAGMYFWVLGAMTLVSQNFDIVKSRYKEIIEHSGEAKLLCKTGTLTIAITNEYFGNILGYRPGELMGKPISDLFWSKDSYEEFRDLVLTKQFFSNFMTQLRTNNNEKHPVIISGQIIYIDDCIELTVVDIGSLEKENADLTRSKITLQTMMRFSDTIMFTQDLDGRFIDFYSSDKYTFPLAGSDFIGRKMENIDIIPSDVSRTHSEYIKKVILYEKSEEFNHVFKIDDQEHYFRVIMGPLFDDGGKLAGVVGSFSDITDIKRKEEEKSLLQDEINRRRDFINLISHELRTPLQPIIGYITLIINEYGDNIDETILNYLQICLQNAEIEKNVLDSITRYLTLINGKLRINIKPTLFGSLIEKIIELNRFEGEAEIIRDYNDELMICCDPKRFYFVLESLISNAVTFNNPPKKIKIGCRETDDLYLITITDNGFGIPPSKHEEIFQPFSILEHENIYTEESRVGLGLTLAREYVALHGGTIEVEAAEPEGSIFTIKLPRQNIL